MKTRLLLCLSFLSALAVVPATATTLNVAASDTLSGGLYNYTYTFTVSGGNVDNIYLESADLSPLSLTVAFDNSATTAWSWLGNNTPQNYLQFFRTSGALLTPADSLRVMFSSALAPSQTNFAVALNGSTGDTTASLTNVLAPAAITAAVPEPASLGLAGMAAVLLFAGLSARKIRSVGSERG